MPIVSTSANIAGEKPIIKMNQLENYFGNKIDYIVEGQIGNNKQPSRKSLIKNLYIKISLKQVLQIKILKKLLNG